MTFQEERYEGCIEELMELFPLHWEEIALCKDHIKLAPWLERYEALDKAKLLKIFTAREDGELVGYHVSTLMPHPHYMNDVMMFTDIFFLRADHRRGVTGYKFLKAIREYARSLKAVHLVIGTKMHKDLGILLERLGGRETDTLYAICLR